MKTATRSILVATAAISLICLFLFLGRPAKAENPISVGPTGQPAKWGTFPINYTVDGGPLGGLTNAQANSLVQQAFGNWTSVASALLSATQNGAPGLPGDGADGNIDTVAA